MKHQRNRWRFEVLQKCFKALQSFTGFTDEYLNDRSSLEDLEPPSPHRQSPSNHIPTIYVLDLVDRAMQRCTHESAFRPPDGMHCRSVVAERWMGPVRFLQHTVWYDSPLYERARNEEKHSTSPTTSAIWGTRHLLAFTLASEVAFAVNHVPTLNKRFQERHRMSLQRSSVIHRMNSACLLRQSSKRLKRQTRSCC